LQNSRPGESGVELHQAQPCELGSYVQRTEKSWCDILKSWTPTDNKSFVLSVAVLTLLCIGIFQYAQMRDSSMLMEAFWAACAYGGISGVAEKIISAFPFTRKDKNEQQRR